LTFGSDFGTGPRKFGNMTNTNLRGDQTPTGISEQDGDRSEVLENGGVAGTAGNGNNSDISKLNRQLSVDSAADDRLERLSIAESEGATPLLINTFDRNLL
jgi:hypothetical protein